jgi:hypothetical protein
MIDNIKPTNLLADHSASAQYASALSASAQPASGLCYYSGISAQTICHMAS